MPEHVPLDPSHRSLPDWDLLTPEEQVQHYVRLKQYYCGTEWPADPTIDVPDDHPQRGEIDEVLFLNCPPLFRERLSSQ